MGVVRADDTDISYKYIIFNISYFVVTESDDVATLSDNLPDLGVVQADDTDISYKYIIFNISYFVVTESDDVAALSDNLPDVGVVRADADAPGSWCGYTNRHEDDNEAALIQPGLPRSGDQRRGHEGPSETLGRAAI